MSLREDFERHQWVLSMLGTILGAIAAGVAGNAQSGAKTALERQPSSVVVDQHSAEIVQVKVELEALRHELDVEREERRSHRHE